MCSVIVFLSQPPRPPFRQIRPCKTDLWQLGTSTLVSVAHFIMNAKHSQQKTMITLPHHRTDASWLALVPCSHRTILYFIFLHLSLWCNKRHWHNLCVNYSHWSLSLSISLLSFTFWNKMCVGQERNHLYLSLVYWASLSLCTLLLKCCAYWGSFHTVLLLWVFCVILKCLVKATCWMDKAS